LSPALIVILSVISRAGYADVRILDGYGLRAVDTISGRQTDLWISCDGPTNWALNHATFKSGCRDRARPSGVDGGVGSSCESKTLRFGQGFKVIIGNRRVQAAQMVIAPAGKEGDPGTGTAGADQWLFVLSGRGTALVKSRRIDLKVGSLLLIERGPGED
jgi:hypothetical protein